MAWDPQQYLKFGDQRFRPGFELLNRISFAAGDGTVELIYDLGCGTGALTAALAARWPTAQVIGVDSSPEMQARARAELPEISWLEADIASWRPERPPDLIYSNATLHWVDDHPELFPRLLRQLKPGGVLAVQMPDNFGAPSHQLMNQTGRDGPWAAKLGAALWREPVFSAERYYAWLAPGAAEIDIWETTYSQVLHGPDPVLEWVRGSGLRPILNALAPDERPNFEAEYARRLRAAYPARPDGETLFPFRRIFLVARAASP